jgi:mxaJ protein
LALLLLSGCTAVQARELKVCADPNNMPFSNEQEQGFENRLARLVADEIDAKLTYVWWAQRRGLVTNALNAGLCDLIAGTASIDGVLLTYPPYYRSSYVFVLPAAAPDIHSLDDPRLETLEVGVELVGDDGANTPPAAALARRGITANVHGFSVLGDYSQPNPPARIVDAVADGTIAVALAWGPMAGYFAAHAATPLKAVPVAEQFDTPDLPMAFDISMALRLDEGELRMRIEDALQRRKADVDHILADYDVPRLDPIDDGGGS